VFFLWRLDTVWPTPTSACSTINPVQRDVRAQRRFRFARATSSPNGSAGWTGDVNYDAQNMAGPLGRGPTPGALGSAVQRLLLPGFLGPFSLVIGKETFDDQRNKLAQHAAL
jgi:hypothetical protein